MSTEEIFMFLTRHTNFVAQILAEALLSQKKEEKNL